MKNLIMLNGTMGVGKTATGRQLQKLLPNCVFLDGDWCWDASPFIVTEETKKMVLNNIGCLLNNFMACPAYDNVLFCWVMHEQGIIDDVLSQLRTSDYRLFIYSLICSPEALEARLRADIRNGLRTADVVSRSRERLPNYMHMDTDKIEVGDLSPKQAAERIYDKIYGITH